MVGLVGLVGLLAQEPPGPGLGMIIVWNSDQLGGLSVLGITFYKGKLLGEEGKLTNFIYFFVITLSRN